MNKQVPQKVWSRPEISRLGKIRDVAGGPGGSVTNNGKAPLDKT